MNNILSKKIKLSNLILTLMIVSLHSTFSWGVEFTSGIGYVQKEIMTYINILTTVTVGGFFVISSYLFFYNFKSIKNDYLPKLKKRCMSVLIPYFLWGILTFVYYYITTNFTNIFGTKTVPNSLFGIVKYIFLAEGDPPLWYLRVLMEFVVLSPIFFFIIKKVGKISWIFCPIFLVINMIIIPSYSTLLYWIPFITLGTYLALHNNKIVIGGYFKNNRKFMLSLLILISLSYSAFLLTIDNEQHPIFYLWRFISVFVFWFLLDYINVEKIKKIPNDTFFIYCTHFIIIEMVRGVLFKTIGIKSWSILLIYILTFIMTLLIIKVTSIILKRFIPKLYQLLTGGR